MKKAILGALALSVIATPALAAPRDDYRPNQRNVFVQQQQRGNAPQFRAAIRNDRAAIRNERQAQRAWRKGERFDYRQARNYRVVNDYRARNLRTPPRGYRYVQSGNDAVLVGITTGLIAAVIAGALN